MSALLLLLIPGIFVAGFAAGFGVREMISRRRWRRRAAAKLRGDSSRRFLPVHAPAPEHVGDDIGARRGGRQGESHLVPGVELDEWLVQPSLTIMPSPDTTPYESPVDAPPGKKHSPHMP
jgi:hypothetical protein